MNPGGEIRYDAAIATLIGVLAVAVSAYTAYVQRQQVRAQVWPILEYGSDNDPDFALWVANKGSGPAIIRHVIVSVDDHPLGDWNAVLKALLGSAHRSFTMDKFGGRVLSPGERLPLLAPHFDRGSDPWKRFDRERFRVGMKVCFCSTLGDCWTLSAWGYKLSKTDETSRCPAPSDVTFKE